MPAGSSASVGEPKSKKASIPSLGPLPKRQNYGQVYSQDATQRINPFKVNKEKTTTHSKGGFFENVEKEKQMMAKKAAEKSRKYQCCIGGSANQTTDFLSTSVSVGCNQDAHDCPLIYMFVLLQHRLKQKNPRLVNR